jgi:hypothetical protein
MPPQQSHGLLNRLDQLLGFGTHDPTIDLKARGDPRERRLGGAKFAI